MSDSWLRIVKTADSDTKTRITLDLYIHLQELQFLAICLSTTIYSKFVDRMSNRQSAPNKTSTRRPILLLLVFVIAHSQIQLIRSARSIVSLFLQVSPPTPVPMRQKPPSPPPPISLMPSAAVSCRMLCSSDLHLWGVRSIQTISHRKNWSFVDFAKGGRS